MLNGYISDIQCIVTFSKLDFIGADALTIIYAVIGGTDEKKKNIFCSFLSACDMRSILHILPLTCIKDLAGEPRITYYLK